jgi:transposase-like protein
LSDSVHEQGPEDPEAPLEPAELTAWDSEVEVSCPYCGEHVTIGVDPSGGAVQTYIEDCQVCCRPWQVHVSYDDHGAAHVWLEAA